MKKRKKERNKREEKRSVKRKVIGWRVRKKEEIFDLAVLGAKLAGNSQLRQPRLSLEHAAI